MAHEEEPQEYNKLRFDWTNLPPRSPLAQQMTAAQTDCSLSSSNTNSNNKYQYFHPPKGGLGMNLHVWALQLCHALEHDQILVPTGLWKWADDPRSCPDRNNNPWLCYFGDHVAAARCSNRTSTTPIGQRTPTPPIFTLHSAPRTFTRNSPLRTTWRPPWSTSFRACDSTLSQKPSRSCNAVDWGDKGSELPGHRLVSAAAYVRGVQQLQQKSNLDSNNLHVYVASEDPAAIAAFRRAAPKRWHIYTSGPTQQSGSSSMSMGSFRSGAHGLESLAALLVALQANHYVLGTVSNWSRLINELRRHVVDPRCGHCTTMLDLHPGEWPTLQDDRTLSWGSDFARRPAGYYYDNYYSNPWWWLQPVYLSVAMAAVRRRRRRNLRPLYVWCTSQVWVQRFCPKRLRSR